MTNAVPDRALNQELLCIPFGSDFYKPNSWELNTKTAGEFVPRPGVPAVMIDRGSRTPLKINNTIFTFKTPPRPGELIDAGAQLEFIRQFVDRLCGQWNKLLKLFIHNYFKDIKHEVENNGLVLDEKIEKVIGLCERRHWCFSALMPLPRAHIYAPCAKNSGNVEAQDYVCVDFAFWDGSELVIATIDSGQSLIGKKKLEWQRVVDLAPKIVKIPSDTLYKAAPGTLLSLLGPQFRNFWSDELFPSTPFRGRGIADPIKQVA